MSFFQALNFSSTNEDGATELAALVGARRVLCITGSGTRPLDLLAGSAEELVAIDANPIQNHLLALKVAAMTMMDRQHYLGFLGITPASGRSAQYEALRDTLSLASRQFWDRHPRSISRGIWYAGKWERLLVLNAKFLRLLRGRAIGALMTCDDLEEQRQIWSRHFTTRGVLGAVEAAIRSLVWRVAMREPAADHMPSPRDVKRHLDRRFADAAGRFFFRDSDCATLALTGRHQATSALPLHLRPAHYETVRANLGRLTIRTASLAEIGADLDEFDGFSLSDFGSYCAKQDYDNCWRAILSVAAPDARFCERLFLNEAAQPPSARVATDPLLSKRLSRSDTAIIYRIRAGTITR